MPLSRYAMFRIPPTLKAEKRDHVGNEVAQYLEEMANRLGKEGWEFIGVHQVGLERPPGCLTAFSGRSGIPEIHYIAAFRREL